MLIFDKPLNYMDTENKPPSKVKIYFLTSLHFVPFFYKLSNTWFGKPEFGWGEFLVVWGISIIPLWVLSTVPKKHYEAVVLIFAFVLCGIGFCSAFLFKDDSLHIVSLLYLIVLSVFALSNNRKFRF